ncbi:nucleotide-binding domain-containing protein [Ornithobacterium rhinotracheale]
MESEKSRDRSYKEKLYKRLQIEHGEKSGVKIENTNFKGEHFVECYIIKDNTVVAIDSIDVPISI